MSARKELPWDLLDRDSDPVPGDPERVSDAQRRYANIAQTIHETADRLRKVTAADGLKGKYADKMQDKAKDVVEDLTKAYGRYDAVAKAVGVYQPALQRARDESAAAVRDAEQAKGQQTKAQAMPDPSANRPSGAGPLSQADQDAVAARNRATAAADADLAAAKTRLQNAVDALDAAGRALEQAVSKNAFKHDHLTDTALDKFNNFLKGLVKVLQLVGIGLAALALFFPGVGLLVALGAAVAVLTLVADIILIAQRETSWFELGMAVAGVVLLGAGGLLAKGLQKIGSQIRATLRNAFKNPASQQVENTFEMNVQNYMSGAPGHMSPAEIIAARNTGLAQASDDATAAAQGVLPASPEWWQITRPGYLTNIGNQMRDNNIITLLKNGTFLEKYPKFFGGVDVVAGLRSAAGHSPGIAAPSAWYYVLAGGLTFLGYASFGLGLGAQPIPFIPGDTHGIPGADAGPGD